MLNNTVHRTSRYTILLLLILVSLVFPPKVTQALGTDISIPDFRDFSKSVQNNQADVLRGVYVPDVLAFPVIQQPKAEPGYVSRTDGEITQFGMPSEFGNVGLLAHNNLSGRYFSKLAVGQEVRLIYGDGEIEYFVINKILKFQAFDPTNPYSSFRDLANNETLTAQQLFNQAYRGERHVTFQTCLEANGDLSWGRLFVIATPKPQDRGPNRFDWQSPR